MGITVSRAFLLAVVANIVGGLIVVALIEAHARMKKEAA